jgi:cysteine dioxygenase
MTQTIEHPIEITGHTHPLRSSLGDFINGLRDLEREPITTARVLDFLTQMMLRADAVAPYVMWNPESYARNLIYRDSLFEVLALCWLPGQHTAIHSHAGQLGWVTVVQGEIEARNYRFVRSDRIDQSPAVGKAQGRPVEVELINAATCVADGSVATVDRRQTTHRMGNLEKSEHGSVSLHIYSKPIDFCAAFNEEERCVDRRRLEYYSENGILKKPA